MYVVRAAFREVEDLFNRANANLTTPWTQTNNPRVNSNRCEATGTVPFSGTTVCHAVHQTRLNTDTMTVSAVVINPVGTKHNTQATALSLRQTSTINSGTRVAFEFSTTGGNAIVSYSGATRTSRATDTTNVASGDTVMITAEGNVYTGWINGAAQAQWIDSGSLMTIGVNNRYFGLINGVVGSFGSGSWSYALDSISAKG